MNAFDWSGPCNPSISPTAMPRGAPVRRESGTVYTKAVSWLALAMLLATGVAHGGPTDSRIQRLWKVFTQLSTSHQKGASEAAKQQKSAQQLTSLSLAALGNVEVTTVSKEPEEVWRTPAAIYVITQDDIRRSGATTLPDVLRLAPGVEVAQIDSDHWALGIRGFNSQLSRDVLVLIDGRSVYTPLYAGVYWEVQNLPLEDVDRIEVIRGPGGTIWGANAVNGVINIITKGARDTRGALVSAGGGNVDKEAGLFQYGGGLGKAFSYRVYGMGFSRGPEFHLDHDAFDQWAMGQGGFRTDWNPNGHNALTVQGDLYNGDDGERTAIGYYNPPSQRNVDGTDEVAGGNLLALWKRQLGSGSDVEVKAYFDRTSRLGPQYGETRDTFDVDFLHHLTLRRDQDFIWGLGARMSPSEFIQVAQTVNFLPNRQTDKLYSAFVQDQVPVVPNQLWLTVGSKLEHNIYTGFEVEPSARLLWEPTAHQTLWAAVTRAVRTPSRLEENLQIEGLLEPNPPVFVQIVGNPNFFAERLIGYEAGYRSLIRPRLYLDVATFYNNYNYLYGYGAASVFATLAPPQHVVISFPVANAVEGSTAGFEIAPDWRPKSWWQLKGSYSYLHTDLRSRPGYMDANTVLSDEGSSPAQQADLQSLFNLPRQLEFDQTLRYVSDLPNLSVPAYTTADLRLGWRPGPHLELSLSARSLLQSRHVEFVGDPGLPVETKRSVYAKINWKW